MARTLGLIGSGLIGTSLARLAVAAGLEVVLSNSRGPESLTELVSALAGKPVRPLRKRPPAPVTSWWSPSR